MTARTKSKITPKYKTKYKTKHKVKNWPAYEAALKKRGDITVWFDEGAIRAWNAPPSGRPGGQPKYSDVAIVTSLTLRLVFHLALRSSWSRRRATRLRREGEQPREQVRCLFESCNNAMDQDAAASANTAA